MFKPPRYIRNSFAISFPRYPTIRRKANDFEDVLKGQYVQPHIISVPDDLDPEVPRMIFGSKHGFSQIVVSQINATLNVQYSPNWQQSIYKGKDYLLERAPILFNLLDILEQTNPHYCGLITLVRLATDADEKAILNCMSELAPAASETENLHDIHLKITTVISEHFFSNITFRNYRVWKASVDQQELQPLSRRSASDQGIEILGDFNDRYRFNEEKDYSSSRNAMENIINQGFEEAHQAIERVKELQP